MGFGGFVGGGLVDIVGSMASGAQNAYYNRKASAQAYDRTLEMSNTAHTREVQDLRNAGLNPILSATGGSGASAPNVPAAAPAHYDFSGVVSSAMEGFKLSAQKDLLLAQAEAARATSGIKKPAAAIGRTLADFLGKFGIGGVSDSDSFGSKAADKLFQFGRSVRHGLSSAGQKFRDSRGGAGHLLTAEQSALIAEELSGFRSPIRVIKSRKGGY